MSPATHRLPPHRRLLPAALLLALTCAAGLGCSSVDLGEVNVFSTDDEWKLGRELSAEVEKDLTLVRDGEANAIIQRMGLELASRSRLADRPWQFHLVRSDDVNAFNIPGGHVYVNDALVAAAGNASELMGVLAHETAHGVERHATQQLTKSYGIGMVLEMALGKDPGTLEGLAANILAGGTLARYSRDAEDEADGTGARLMAAAGYDPQGMISFFEKLLEMRRSRPGKVERFFASHPLTEDRIAHVRRVIATLPPGERRQDSQDFQRLKQLLAR